jgi:Mn2+/Fe2+ NRAMP family transporter
VATAATLYTHHQEINSAADAARALAPLAGRYASLLFAVGLLNAGIMAASILPISTAYAVSEGFGWQSGIGRKFAEAPRFFILYTLFIVVGAVTVLFPQVNLVKLMLFSQTANGILLPVILILMLLLINNPKVMGKHTNSFGFNIVAWLTTIGIIALTLLLTFFSIFR